MKLADITDRIEDFFIRAKYFWQDLVNFLFQSFVLLVAYLIIGILNVKDFCERRVKQWKK